MLLPALTVLFLVSPPTTATQSPHPEVPPPPPVHMTPPHYVVPTASPRHYGYTPIPQHSYSPAPHHGYSPAPQHYAPHAPHVQHAPHHGYGYSPAPPVYSSYPQPSHPPPPPTPQYEGPPACSKNTSLAWCLEDAEYPAYDIAHAIEYNYAGVAALYKDVLANTDNSVDRLVELSQETYLCPSSTSYITPLRAINTVGKWRVIVNGVKAHYETLTQTARVELCSTAGESCPLVPHCYNTKCVQKHIYHRFLVYNPYDHYFPFQMETFKLPSSCACYNGPYEDAH